MARAMKDLGVKINVQLDIPHRFKWPSNRTEWIEFIVLDHSSKAGVAETWLQERILNMFQEEMLYGPRVEGLSPSFYSEDDYFDVSEFW